jgi:hypothetical protein
VKHSVVLAACLLAVTATSAQEGLSSGWAGGDMDLGKSRFIKLRLLDFGLVSTFGQEFPSARSVRLASVSCALHRFRVGLTVCDDYESVDDWFDGIFLPVHVGYTLWSNLRPVGRVWAALPDVYIEASAGLWGMEVFLPRGFGPRGRLALGCDLDLVGIGVGVEAGGMSLVDERHSRRVNFLYGLVQFRLPAFSIAF